MWWFVKEATVSDTEERAPATTDAKPVNEEGDTLARDAGGSVVPNLNEHRRV